ncbi:SDR family NAD(P)-dependent oxidoreductase [Nocardioides gilvus]|uniref:SDR family NAD(P)-dependent oxidoreductase n=1 Tax=Nocardioides gilvus TaxID=1735589 RepID=UPI000D740791|nr:SDR family oxidoreductase [Nocardioides gilvus]
MEHELRPLAGQIAVVTGGSSGLGLGFARVLGRAGASVVIGALPGPEVAEAVAHLESLGIRAAGHELDMGDLGAVEALRDRALEWGSLDIWINNAGASGVYGPTWLTPPAVFERVCNANIRGVFHGTRAALGVMVPQGSGHLVNVWGKGDTRPTPLQNTYGSSKAWNRSFTRTVRAEVAETGVRVHGFNPGLVRTEMLAHVTVTPGMERKVRALPYVVGLWGQSADDAAAPVVGVLLGSKDDHRDLTVGTVVGRGLKSVAQGNLRRSRRMTLDVRVVGE